MKTRIVKHTLGSGESYYVAQYQPSWLPFFWLEIKHFYRSEFSEMPGWWSNQSNTLEDAQRTIVAWKLGKMKVTKEVMNER